MGETKLTPSGLPPLPSPKTRAALVALLKGDSAITPAHRARILEAFDGPTSPGAGWLSASAVAKALGVSLPTVLRWVEAGHVRSRRAGGRVTLVNREECAMYAARRPLAHKSPRQGP